MLKFTERVNTGFQRALHEIEREQRKQVIFMIPFQQPYNAITLIFSPPHDHLRERSLALADGIFIQAAVPSAMLLALSLVIDIVQQRTGSE